MEKAVKSLNIKGHLHFTDKPLVMGILNVTPDSFYPPSRKQSDAAIHRRIEEILDEGGTIVDVGGYSSRPAAADVSEAEEMQRLLPALSCLKTHYPDVAVSVDTFRAEVARRAVEEYGAAIVNDISGGEMDGRMFETVAALHVPYILMHMRGTPATMQQQPDYADMMEEIMLYFAEKLRTLQLLGAGDIILDPGFGFGKTLDRNYELMRALPGFAVFERPLLVGVSRKSMIYKLLNNTPDECLNGTTVLNTFALLHGADILRVHDVKAAVEAIEIVYKLKNG
ncbi:MAG: dihydropteroate synthase [Tannerella sp.]|nr:dihydropteroate synthase [Tannerella sp.]